MTLTENQRKHLRKLAHNLKPVIIVGGNGASESLLAELDSTIAHHELIKVKIAAGDRDDRDAVIEEILKASGAVLVNRIGNIATLYRAPKKTTDKKGVKIVPKITLPK